MEKNCEGCLIFIHVIPQPQCSLHIPDPQNECPCTECVVKMMCVTACNDRQKWGGSTDWDVRDYKEHVTSLREPVVLDKEHGIVV